MAVPTLQSSEILQINVLTIQDVADWAKVSTKTVYRWIYEKKIPAIQPGKRIYRVPEKAAIEHPKQNGFAYLLE